MVPGLAFWRLLGLLAERGSCGARNRLGPRESRRQLEQLREGLPIGVPAQGLAGPSYQLLRLPHCLSSGGGIRQVEQAGERAEVDRPA